MAACQHTFPYRVIEPPNTFPVPPWESILKWLNLSQNAIHVLLECFTSHNITDLALPWITWEHITYICGITTVHVPSLQVFLSSLPYEKWEPTDPNLVTCLQFLNSEQAPCGCTAASVLQSFLDVSSPWLTFSGTLDDNQDALSPIMSEDDFGQLIVDAAVTSNPAYSQLHVLRKLLFAIPVREFLLSRRFCLQAVVLTEMKLILEKLHPSLTVIPRSYAHPALPRSPINVFELITSPLPFPPSATSASAALEAVLASGPPSMTVHDAELAVEQSNAADHAKIVSRALAGYLFYAVCALDEDTAATTTDPTANSRKKRPLSHAALVPATRREHPAMALAAGCAALESKTGADPLDATAIATVAVGGGAPAVALAADEKEEEKEEIVPPQLHELLAHGILNRWVPALNLTARELRASLLRPDFSMFTLPLRTHPETLLQLSFFFFHDLRLPQALGVPPARLYRALELIAASYYPRNEYHNWYHGFATLHHTWVLLKHALLHVALTPLQLFGALLSAAAHDIGHPGNDNKFEYQAHTCAAQLYAGQSVLENHHCTLALALLCDPAHDCDVLAGLTPQDYRRVRGLFVGCALGTDMYFHHEITRKLEAINTHVLRAPTLSPAEGMDIPVELRDRPLPSPEQVASALPQRLPAAVLEDCYPAAERGFVAACAGCAAYAPKPPQIQEKSLTPTVVNANAHLAQALAAAPANPAPWQGAPLTLPSVVGDLLCRALVHTADIACQSLAPRVVLAWTERLRAEFSRQARREELLGLHRTPHMCGLEDPRTHARAQVGFVRTFMRPLWLELARLCPGMEVSLTHLAATSHMWEVAEASGDLDAMDIEDLDVYR